MLYESYKQCRFAHLYIKVNLQTMLLFEFRTRVFISLQVESRVQNQKNLMKKILEPALFYRVGIKVKSLR